MVGRIEKGATHGHGHGHGDHGHGHGGEKHKVGQIGKKGHEAEHGKNKVLGGKNKLDLNKLKHSNGDKVLPGDRDADGNRKLDLNKLKHSNGDKVLPGDRGANGDRKLDLNKLKHHDGESVFPRGSAVGGNKSLDLNKLKHSNGEAVLKGERIGGEQKSLLQQAKGSMQETHDAAKGNGSNSDENKPVSDEAQARMKARVQAAADRLKNGQNEGEKESAVSKHAQSALDSAGNNTNQTIQKLIAGLEHLTGGDGSGVGAQQQQGNGNPFGRRDSGFGSGENDTRRSDSATGIDAQDTSAVAGKDGTASSAKETGKTEHRESHATHEVKTGSH